MKEDKFHKLLIIIHPKVFFTRYAMLLCMTGRTHDLAAFTTITYIIATHTVPPMTLATAITAFAGAMIGGLMPDIDDATSDFWDKIPAGTFFGKLLNPLLGHHRMISHSLIGMGIAGYALFLLFESMKHILLVDLHVVWWVTMIGFASHLIMDSLTREGIPLLFPLPVRFGFPPIKLLRTRTGSAVEHAVIFPSLIAANIYLLYVYYPAFLAFIGSIKR